MRRLAITFSALLILAPAASGCTGGGLVDTPASATSDRSDTDSRPTPPSGDVDEPVDPGPDASPGDDVHPGADTSPDWEPSEEFYQRVGNRAPDYRRREFAPGLGVRITYDISSYRVLSGRHVQVRVRARRFFDDPRLTVSGDVEPEFLRAGSLQGGFEWVFKIPALPAGQHRVSFFEKGSSTPTATAPLFVYPYDERDSLLVNASFERGGSAAPDGWTKWQNESGEHEGAANQVTGHASDCGDNMNNRKLDELDLVASTYLVVQ